MSQRRTLVVGASAKPERYSNMALRMLREHGHPVVPINPAQKEIDGIAAVPRIEDVTGQIDTVTMYVNAKQSAGMADALCALKPKRVIFNPGAENEPLRKLLAERGIECVDGCTLVMLRTGEFDQVRGLK